MEEVAIVGTDIEGASVSHGVRELVVRVERKAMTRGTVVENTKFLPIPSDLQQAVMLYSGTDDAPSDWCWQPRKWIHLLRPSYVDVRQRQLMAHGGPRLTKYSGTYGGAMVHVQV